MLESGITPLQANICTATVTCQGILLLVWSGDSAELMLIVNKPDDLNVEDW